MLNPIDVVENKPVSMIIFDALVMANSKINSPSYETIQVSVSGGADSDIMVDICTKFDHDNKIKYVFFNTGIEYQATKEHLDNLEKKYNIEIERVRVEKSVAFTCRNYGVPFLSKFVSENIKRLQKHGFKWEDESFEVLDERYPNCKSALKWWCNAYGEKSRFNINANKYLKEFIITNPPDFMISPTCCTYSKKNPSLSYSKSNNIDVVFLGIRKFENGIRSQKYANCFSPGTAYDNYRPIFWFTDEDKKTYEDCFDVVHSKCYTEYGLNRTGCAGCPFGSRFEDELKVIEKYEPKLYKAINNIFGKSYDYTRKYREFKRNYKPND